MPDTHLPLHRAPTASRPGIFAVGDVRRGNIKRVASAVGEDQLPSPSSTRCFTKVRDGRSADRGEIGPSAQHEVLHPVIIPIIFITGYGRRADALRRLGAVVRHSERRRA